MPRPHGAEHRPGEAAGDRRLIRPRSVEGIARRRAWSRLSTFGIARNAIRFFGGSFREPAEGAASNTVRSVDENAVEAAMKSRATRLEGESARAFKIRAKAERKIFASTERQFRKNDVAIRRAMTILGKQLGR